MAIADTVKNYLEEKSVNYDQIPHPHTATSHETSLASCVGEDQIAKAVIVKDATGYTMVVVPASYYVDMKHVRKQLNREFELVEEKEFAKLFADCEPGAVPPLGPAYKIETYLDEDLTSLADVYFESGDHEHLVHVSGDDFKHLLSGARQGHFSND